MKFSDVSLLYVEDDTDIRDRICNELKTTYPGMCIHAAENGVQGLKMYRAHHPQIVITDISMPLMDGITMAREIRSLNEGEVILIAVTAFSNTENLLGAIEAGINHYLLKPVEYDKLFEVLDKNIENLRLKQQVRQSETRYRTLFDSIDEGFCIIQMIFDQNENPVDYRFLETNPSFEKQTGLLHAAGKSIKELVPGLEEHWFQKYGEIALTGQQARFSDLAAQMGRWFDIFAFRSGEPEDRQVAVLFSDITERKRSEEDLRLAREQLQMITDLMAAGVYYSSRDHRYKWVSQAYARWLGRKPEEIVGHTIEEIIGKESYEVINPYIEQVLEGRQVKFEVEITYGGDQRWVTAVYTPTHDHEGATDGWVAVITDITERKTLELELQQAKEHLESRVAERTAELDFTVIKLTEEIVERKKTELALKEESRQLSKALQELREKEQLLVQQSRTAAMGEMLGFIGNQWRQPLNSLALIVQELSMSCELGDLTQEHLNQSTDKVMQMIRHMSQTIDDFRDFFKPNKEKVEFRIMDVLSKSLKLAEASFFKNTDFPIDIIEQDDVFAKGYPNEYSQVILNILQNSIDVLLERKVEQPRIEIRIYKDKDKAVMTIADNAGGIPEENMDRLFEPYFTTKGPDKGTGIGLFISKTIIEKNMGGNLTVRNSGEGAEFRIEI